MSYRKSTESRGVGAIAARDLGALDWRTLATAPAPTTVMATPTTQASSSEPVQTFAPPTTTTCPPDRVWDPIEQICRVPPTTSTGTLATAPTRTATATYQAPSTTTPLVVDTHVSSTESVPSTEAPAVTKPAGIVPGTPPEYESPARTAKVVWSALYTPQGPSLRTAISSRNRALDRIAEAERQAAELEVPTITAGMPDNTKKILLYGALGLAALYLITRR